MQLGNEFTKLAKKLEPSVVYITADFTPKTVSNPHKRSQPQADEEENGGGASGGDDGAELFKRFFRNGPLSGDESPRAFRQEHGTEGPGAIHRQLFVNYIGGHVERRATAFADKACPTPRPRGCGAVGAWLRLAGAIQSGIGALTVG